MVADNRSTTICTVQQEPGKIILQTLNGLIFFFFFLEANQEAQLLALHRSGHENFTIESLFFC